jgi:hypothetical protein
MIPWPKPSEENPLSRTAYSTVSCKNAARPGRRDHSSHALRRKLAKELGAHVYIDSTSEDAVAALQRMGGAQAILRHRHQR